MWDDLTNGIVGISSEYFQFSSSQLAHCLKDLKKGIAFVWIGLNVWKLKKTETFEWTTPVVPAKFHCKGFHTSKWTGKKGTLSPFKNIGPVNLRGVYKEDIGKSRGQRFIGHC